MSCFVQGDGTVTDLLLSTNNNRTNNSSSSSQSTRRTFTTKITPVGAWEEREENTTSSSSSSSSSSHSTLDPALWAAQQAAQQALVAAGAEEDLALFEKARSHHAEAILSENEDLVRQFLDGQLCVRTLLKLDVVFYEYQLTLCFFLLLLCANRLIRAALEMSEASFDDDHR